jgi:hypothetical protein
VLRTLSKEIPIFKARADINGVLHYGFSKEVIERLENVVAPFMGTLATKDQFHKIEHVLECELRKILKENGYVHSTGW